ncbi:MAG: hypothetical protein GXY40_02300 [Syntrophomonadaceae bacterium]|nr:hypothetical protein [Syntrophomonadaceae bacterium]
MARPVLDVDIVELVRLHSSGYPDGEIAKLLGVSRRTIIRKRQELGLEANRKSGEKGYHFRETEPYWQAVRRALRHVGNYINEAAREYYQKTKDYERYFICMLLEPKPMFHAAPGPWAADPQKMYFKHVKYITDFEKTMDMTSLSGVPGPAILELARLYKSADEELCKDLARQAVEGAGFVNAHDTVEMVDECIPPESYEEFWEEEERKAMDWTPIKQWEPVKKLGKAIRRVTNTISLGTGRKGRGGGRKNIKDHQAYQAAMGY